MPSPRSHRPQSQPSIIPKSGYLILLIAIIMSLACNSSSLLAPFSTPTPPYPTPVPAPPLPEALVTFHVQIPADSPTEEPIFLNVLDEVTGLALNVHRHGMEDEGEFQYTVSLPFPVGSTIKYRYSRQGNYSALEHTSDRRPVRYRLYQVEAPGRVQDVVSAWSDTTFNAPTGRIMGTATDSATAEPIPNLLVAAGGQHTLTASDGSFVLEGLPPGTHNLVAYAMDATYQTFQQGATVASESTTPAILNLAAAPLVDMEFRVMLPGDTMPAVPIRMAGSLLQLGNTFADLEGGMSTVAARMPTLTPLPDGRYSLALALPAGADLYYKYTLGDGFWNAEHDYNGNFRLRHLIVPEESTIIEDVVDTWGASQPNAILFQLSVPSHTPLTDSVSIQFNPYGWTEPIPMWYLGNQKWVYVLYSPLEILEKFGYRYCRNDQCGSADDLFTMGNDSFGRLMETKNELQSVEDSVEEWAWLDPPQTPITVTAPDIKTRGEDFQAGIEFHPAYHPTWATRMPVALKEVQSSGANWVILTPTWTVTRSAPLVIEPVPGRDALWWDLSQTIELAQAYGLKVALNPTPNFPMAVEEWWASAPRDFSWWLVWFERYRAFALHHADLAQRQSAEAIILGGDWISPALPGGRLADDSPSGVPEDADERWRNLLAEIREHYSGDLIWALPFPQGISDSPPFLDEVDGIHLLWSVPLADNAEADEAEFRNRAIRILDQDLRPFQAQVQLPLTIAAAYPSAEGGVSGCLLDPLVIEESACLNVDFLSRPFPDIPAISRDLAEQALAYNALLSAISGRDWIGGFVSRGYYPPAALQDKSISVHGKPAGDVLAYWFPRLLGKVSP